MSTTAAATATTTATQDSIQALVEELFNYGDNAVMYSPSSSMEPMEYVPEVKKQKRSKKSTTAATTTAAAAATWELKNAQDAPFISWTDSQFQYNVQNPANYGDLLLKIQMYNRGRPVNNCGLYLDTKNNKVIVKILNELLRNLENMWVDRNNGNVPKVEGLIQSVALLPSWRIIYSDDDKRKGEKSTVIIKGKKSGGGGSSRKRNNTKQMATNQTAGGGAKFSPLA